MITLKSWLKESWHDPRGELKTLVNPATEAPLAQTGAVGFDLPSALEYGRAVGGAELRAMTFAARGELLKRMSKSLFEVRDALIEASIASGGTTRGDAKFDIDGATGTLSFYADLGAKLGATHYMLEGNGQQLTRSPRFFGYHLMTPRRGIAVHVNAFNFPAWGMAEKAAVALLAGMPVLTKPATATALLAYRVMERWVEAVRLPPGVLQFACGDVGDLLEHLGPHDVLAFTGSASTGAKVRSLPAVVHRSTRVNIEADSLNAAVLGADAEPGSDTYRMFVRDVTREITQKAGQKCTAVRRILVPASRIDDVQADLADELAGIKVGDPALEDVRMGPLATAAQAHDVRAGIALLQGSGARIVFGDPAPVDAAGVPAGKGFFVSPVLLRADEPRSARAVHEHEVFGPVATLLPYGDALDAAAILALGDGMLVASVYTDDRDLLDVLVHEVAPYNGRVFCGSGKIAEQAVPPGAVLPALVHGGPGRAGGGEELGGERGLDFYWQRTAIQGDRALLERILGVGTGEVAG